MNADEFVQPSSTTGSLPTPAEWFRGHQPRESARDLEDVWELGGSLTSTVEGRVTAVDEDGIWVRCQEGAAEDVAIALKLPRSLDLCALVGHTLRITSMTEEEPLGAAGAQGRPARTVHVQGEQGDLWLVARTGKAHGVTHALSRNPREPSVHAALSQRPDGPLVIGTNELQWLVPLGSWAMVYLKDGSAFRAELIDRRDGGDASYIIAAERLFAGRSS